MGVPVVMIILPLFGQVSRMDLLKQDSTPTHREARNL